MSNVFNRPSNGLLDKISDNVQNSYNGILLVTSWQLPVIPRRVST